MPAASQITNGLSVVLFSRFAKEECSKASSEDEKIDLSVKNLSLEDLKSLILALSILHNEVHRSGMFVNQSGDMYLKLRPMEPPRAYLATAEGSGALEDQSVAEKSANMLGIDALSEVPDALSFREDLELILVSANAKTVRYRSW